MPPNRSCSRCGSASDLQTRLGLCPVCVGRISILGALGADSEIEDSSGSGFKDYELLEEAGRGAMGVVYRARQLSLNRVVALKMILGGQFAGERERHRFQSEAEAAARLEHPNIVPIYEVGEHDGRPFYAMRWIDGGILGGPVDPILSAKMVATLARAIHCAHQNGVLHRDLKPGNILLDRSGTPFIADFGLARRLDDSASLTGSLAGTPAYMAPEQAACERGITTAADIWGLGAVLYFLLTGKAPHGGLSVSETLHKARDGLVTPPSVFNRDLDRDLETICLKCLRPKPADRYNTADQLADDLDRWLSHKPILARPTTMTEHLRLWIHRRPLAALLSFLLILVGITGLGGILWQWGRAEKATERAKAQSLQLLGIVNRLEQERAEELFQRGDAPAAVAQLASILRRDPTNRAVGERLLSALALRPFLVPISEIPRIKRAIISAQIDQDKLRLITVYNQNQVQAFEAVSGDALSAEFIIKPGDPFPAFSRDGSQVACVNADGLPEVRDAHSSALRLVLQHRGASATNRPFFLEFSSDGKRILAAWPNIGWGVWDLSSERPIAKGVTESPLKDVDFCANGTALVITMQSGTIRILDAQSGSLVAEPPTTQPAARFSRLSPDGHFLAVIRGSNQMEWCDISSGALVYSWQSPEPILNITCGEDNESAMLQGETTAYLCSARAKGLAGGPFPRRATGARLGLAPRTNLVLAITDNGLMRSFHRRALPAPVTLHHGDDLKSVTWSKDGINLLALGTNSSLSIWNPTTGKPAGRLQIGGAIGALSDDMKSMLAFSNQTAQISSLPGGEIRATITQDEGVITCADLHPSDGTAILGTINGKGLRWLTASNALTGFHNSPYQIRSISWAPDGKHRAVRWGVYVTLLDTDRFGWWTNLQHEGFVTEANFSHNSRLVATSSGDYRARLWDANSGAMLAVMQHDGPVSKIRLSPDGRYVATIADVRGRHVYLWSLPKGRLIASALSHPGNVLDMDFSSDSLRLATADDAGSVRTWDPASGLPVSEPLRHPAPVRSVRFSPSGDVLATAAEDGMVRLWKVPGLRQIVPAWLPDLAESLAGEQLEAGGNFRFVPWTFIQTSLARLDSASPDDPAAAWLKSAFLK